MPLIVSKATKTVLVPEQESVGQMFPAAPVLRNGSLWRAVPHGLRETLMLRHLGFSCPNPMGLHYDWPGSTPYAVQVATCQMLTENPRAYVLNHMGTGKTKCALWAWDYLNRMGLAGKLLVVAPLSTLHVTWKHEVFATLPGRRIEVLHGTKAERLACLARPADVYVVNHDGVRTIQSELSVRADVDVLVLDELAVYRNNSDRSKAMRKFAQKFAIVWGMTGSPMPNEPTDVWAQGLIVTPNRVPRYRTHARDALMTQVAPYVWKPRPNAVEKAFSWMQPACRYKLEDVVELPDLISRTIDVELSTEQAVVYKRVASAMSAMVKNKQITAANAGVQLGKLLQIAGGWVYTNHPEFVRLDPSPRIVAMADIIKSAEHKVLVAVPYRHMIEGISRLFDRKDIAIEHCVVHGETTDREKYFNLFQSSDKYKVMLVHPQCVRHGLTLTAADTIIWYLPTTSLDTYDQFNARFRRIGQKHKQQLFHLQATTVERKIYRLLGKRQKLQNTFLELVENATG